MDVGTIRTRVSSLLTEAPFEFAPAADPFSFGLDPAQTLDKTFRIEVESGPVTGGSNFSEQRVDYLRIDLARLQNNAPETCYRTLLTDATSMAAAVTRDGLEGGGDYNVPDEGRGVGVLHEPGRAFSVLRLSLPVDYEAQM